MKEYNVVAVTYEVNSSTNKVYNFKIDTKVLVEAGMLAIVESKNGFGLTRVVAVYTDMLEHPSAFKKATAWVVGVVSLEQYHERKKREKHKDILEELLRDRIQEAGKHAELARPTKNDEIAKQILEELKGL